MTTPADEQRVAAAIAALAVLNEQTDQMTGQLAGLREAVTAARLELNDVRDTHLMDLREANAQLVIAALGAKELESRAELAHQQQIQFLAMVAHELRNPLTPIRTVASLLGHAKVDPPQLARLQAIIERQVTHMSRLIDDLMDGSRVGTGTFRLEHVVLELAHVLEAAVLMSKPAMDKRLQFLNVTFPPAPVLVKGDVVRLTQIFSNLLDNASKYTPAGGVISLTMAAHDQAVTVKVADNGIGIGAQTLPHVFELFVQEPSASAFAKHSQGFGIGLAVVRDLVHAHGGSVTVSSAGHNLGSEFIVTFRRSEDDDTP